VLALVSLGMLMGMSTLLTILATARSTPGWEVFPFLFVLTLFTAAVVSINVAFSRRVW
jgi:ABC-type microcin C transport system permease subunit YejE